ncbi:MAG: TlpA disulfide reductase family protein [Candidatus Methylacidiphilales bacterium]|nr:TlpA disulfide reductase family protein [Candidatus Methylacidiphilales bacterium]
MKPMIGAISLMLAVGLGSTVHARSSQNNVGSQLGSIDVKIIENKPEGEWVGKPKVVEFWATWCGPCRDSIPHMNKIHDQFKDRGLVIIGITDEDRKDVREFTKEIPMHYVVATDEKARLKKSLAVTAIPHAVVVDKAGKIVWEGHPLQLEDKVVEDVLK